MPHNDWNPPHSHDPNPEPPSDDPTLTIIANDQTLRFTPQYLATLPQAAVRDCYIVSTGHGTSGPFAFKGVRLLELANRYTNNTWAFVDIVSGDGFRTRLRREDLVVMGDRPAILSLEIDGRPLERIEGLVRLIVPNESDDALRQIKWVSEIRVY